MTPSKKLAAAAPAGAPAGTYRYKGHLQAENRRRRAMADEPAVSARYVRDVILPDLAREDGQAAPWSVEDRAIKGRDSWIFKAHTPRAPFPLAIKVYCTAVAPEETVRQTSLLGRYHDAMANRPDLSVPAPWAALPEHRTLVMEWIDEPGLDTALRRAGRRDERIQLFAAAGRWLRHFHDQSDPAIQPLRTDRLRRRIDLLLGGEAGAGLKVRDQTFRSAYAALLRCSAEFAGAPLPHATAHGDFIAKNLLVGRRGTLGIDIGGRPNFPVTHDMFRFLVQAEAERPLFTTASSGIRGPDAEAFLAAYGATDQLSDDRLMTFLYLAATLTRWAHRINLLRQRRYRIFRLGQAMRLRRMARQALTDLQA